MLVSLQEKAKQAANALISSIRHFYIVIKFV